jgi:hypothetical protein
LVRAAGRHILPLANPTCFGSLKHYSIPINFIQWAIILHTGSFMVPKISGYTYDIDVLFALDGRNFYIAFLKSEEPLKNFDICRVS